ncbi:MAG: hypothetical protein ACFFCX_18135 [Candidatus Sifarchaeia archaeon]
MSNSEDWREDEQSQNISCLFCTVVPILMFAALFLGLTLNLIWYLTVFLFFSPLLFGFPLLFYYNRKAFWKVFDSVTD